MQHIAPAAVPLVLLALHPVAARHWSRNTAPRPCAPLACLLACFALLAVLTVGALLPGAGDPISLGSLNARAPGNGSAPTVQVSKIGTDIMTPSLHSLVQLHQGLAISWSPKLSPEDAALGFAPAWEGSSYMHDALTSPQSTSQPTGALTHSLNVWA